MNISYWQHDITAVFPRQRQHARMMLRPYCPRRRMHNPPNVLISIDSFKREAFEMRRRWTVWYFLRIAFINVCRCWIGLFGSEYQHIAYHTVTAKWSGDALLERSEPVLSVLIGVSAEFNSLDQSYKRGPCNGCNKSIDVLFLNIPLHKWYTVNSI